MERRPACDTSYLFPGRGSATNHMTTSTVRKIFQDLCAAGNLSGKHLHPHALRHSYAHILLESGNSVDIVSKLLGHTSSTTTEKFYLKENASDIAKRANIPWLNNTNRKEDQIVPKFLDHNNEADKKTKDAKLRHKRRRQMASLDMFNKKKIKLDTIVENQPNM